jgi:[ribosomal protein S5]-alanine N-acetyltransferase
MNVLAETNRLIIRNWCPEKDAEQALKIYSDPEVTKFIISRADSIDIQLNLLRRWAEKTTQAADGTGIWAIVQKDSREIVGTVILLQLHGCEEQATQKYEIGWHLKKSAWGKGYATEAAKAVLDYGFNTLSLPVIYAVANLENIASICVTQRLGMTSIGLTDKYYEEELEMFKVEASEWIHSN